jgi:hypothetical protein
MKKRQDVIRRRWVFRIAVGMHAMFSAFVPVASSASVNQVCVGSIVDLAAALAAASNNGMDDVILLRSGTYQLAAGLEYTTANSEKLTLSGGYGDMCAQRTGETVLDGKKLVRPLTLKLDGDAEVTIDHLTLYRGKAAEGGNLYADLATDQNELRIDSVRFLFGRGDNSAGGLYVSNHGSVALRNSVFIGNNAKQSAAIRLSTDRAYVINNTVTKNIVDDDTANPLVVWASSIDTTFFISNNIIWGNSEGSTDLYLSGGGSYYLNANDVGVFGGASPGNANLQEDPRFEFCGIVCHDAPLEPSSPLVNMGLNLPVGNLPDTDILGLPRILGTHVDIGAYEADTVFADGFQQ